MDSGDGEGGGKATKQSHKSRREGGQINLPQQHTPCGHVLAVQIANQWLLNNMLDDLSMEAICNDVIVAGGLPCGTPGH